MAWQKGQSGNPGGKSMMLAKAYQDTREYAVRYAKEAIDTYVELMRTGSPSIRKASADAILDRCYGRPIQAIFGMLEASQEGVSLKEMTTDEIKAIIDGRKQDLLEKLYQSGEMKSFIESKEKVIEVIPQKKDDLN